MPLQSLCIIQFLHDYACTELAPAQNPCIMRYTTVHSYIWSRNSRIHIAATCRFVTCLYLLITAGTCPLPLSRTYLSLRLLILSDWSMYIMNTGFHAVACTCVQMIYLEQYTYWQLCASGFHLISTCNRQYLNFNSFFSNSVAYECYEPNSMRKHNISMNRRDQGTSCKQEVKGLGKAIYKYFQTWK